ncbi:MAG TPA: PQQ-binding-like beta-propeller repeat protein [Longimicrobium sp.]|nr:PQQ-binding-like beta-propeller repeat protein [Longimicrobium sp.]
MASDGWWMYQGGPAHGGYVTDTPINSGNAAGLQILHTLELGGPILSVPAVTDGYAYVGVANNHSQPGSNGGGLFKVNLQTGVTESKFVWPIDPGQRDSHGFTGMGCTPAVAGGNVYFVGFDGIMYCVSQADVSRPVWTTNLRYADPKQNQPVTNDFPPQNPTQRPPAAGWSSPLVVGNSVYVGMGEGENPDLFGFVYCLAADTGKVQWIFCTNQLADGRDNAPNQIPALTVQPAGSQPLAGFTAVPSTPTYQQPRGASVWSGIAYDNGMLYITTGNPANGDNGLPAPLDPWTDPHAATDCTLWRLPVASVPKYAYSVLILDAATGTFKAQYLPTQDSSYRPSDIDIDFGGSAAVFTQNGKPVVAAANKNGTLFLLDATDLTLLKQRQLLPYDMDGQRIPSVDPHPTDQSVNPVTPDNCESDNNLNENYSGPFGAPAVDTDRGLIYVGLGGPNYHNASPGIDYQSTPFMRAVKWDTLEDAWPMEKATFNLPTGPVTVERYTNAAVATQENPGFAMYQNPGEACIGSPAIANDVVFVGTHSVSVYAFRAADGTLLWSDTLGSQTDGINGGYGYCMGPAVWQDYVVAGALVAGGDGGVLRIYQLPAGSAA